MSVRQSLLAILDQGPCYGYQLRAEFDRRTGSTWPLNVGQIYNTLEQVLADPEIELVIVGTPSETHYEIAKQVLEAGKHGETCIQYVV